MIEKTTYNYEHWNVLHVHDHILQLAHQQCTHNKQWTMFSFLQGQVVVKCMKFSFTLNLSIELMNHHRDSRKTENLNSWVSWRSFIIHSFIQSSSLAPRSGSQWIQRLSQENWVTDKNIYETHATKVRLKFKWIGSQYEECEEKSKCVYEE